MATHDQETRRRLLEAATRLFAARGFRHVSVRQICEAAHANVAAVNYHFGSKLALYKEVVLLAIDTIRSTTDAAMQARAGTAADEKLRTYVGVYLSAIGKLRHSWIHKLMNRELSDPTPALDLIVERVITPRIQYLSQITAELLGCAVSDERVLRSVASLQGQCLIYAHSPIRDRLVPDWQATPSELDKVAHHIAEFSLAGFRAIAREACQTPANRLPPPPRLRRSAKASNEGA